MGQGPKALTIALRDFGVHGSACFLLRSLRWPVQVLRSGVLPCLLLFLLLVPAPIVRAHGALTVAASADPVLQQDELQDRLAELRRKLLGPNPVRPGSDEHTAAIVSLLRMDVPAAHGIVQELLRRHEEPDLLPPAELDRLLERLSENLTGDLSDVRLARSGQDESVQRWLEIYPSYVPVLLELCVARQVASAADGLSAEQRAERLLQDERLHARLAGFLRRLPAQQRRQALRPWIDGSAAALGQMPAPKAGIQRATAARAAGASEDLDLAPVLAAQLDTASGPLLAALQDGLARLTFCAVPFHKQAEFEAWAKENLRFSHAELAKRAALDARAQQERLRSHFETELRGLARQQVEFALRVHPPAWRTLRELFERESLLFAQQELLETAYVVLGRPELRELRPNGATPALRELFQWLDRGFEEDPRNGVRRAPNEAWLSCWARVGRLLGAETQEACVERLLGELASRAKGHEGRIFELLAAFPTPTVRQRVLQRAQALARDNDSSGLGPALDCIEALGIADDAERAAETESLLAACVRNGALKDEQRLRALMILGGMQRPSVLNLLRRLCLPDEAEPLGEALRIKAFAWVSAQSRSRIAQLAGKNGKELEAAANEQLEFLLRCLRAENAPGLHREAILELAQHPPSARNFDEDHRRRIAMRVLPALQDCVEQQGEASLVAAAIDAIEAHASLHRVESTALQVLVEAACHLAAPSREAQELEAEELRRRRQMMAQQEQRFGAVLERLAQVPSQQAQHVLELAEQLRPAELERFALLLLAGPAVQRGLSGFDLEGNERKAWPAARTEAFARQWVQLLLAVWQQGLQGERLMAGDPLVQRAVLAGEKALRAAAAEQPVAAYVLGRALYAQALQASGTNGGPDRAVQLEAARRELLAFVERAPADDPHRPAAQQLLASVQLRLGAADEAVRLLEGAKDQGSRILLAEALLAARSYERAAEFYAELARGESDVGRRVQHELGEIEARIELGEGLDALARRLGAIEAGNDESLRVRLQRLQTRLGQRRDERKTETGRLPRSAAEGSPTKHEGRGHVPPVPANGR